MMKRIRILLFAGLVLASPIAMGAVSDEEFAQLRADLAALSQRFEALAAENAELKRDNQQTAQVAEQAQQDVAAVRESTGGESWADRIKLQGDFRYRFQSDDIESVPDDRNRNRIRARAGLVADLPGNVEAGFGLATGGDDPVSSNQTLGSAGSSKSVQLDLAYFDWTAFENTNVRGGKFKNSFEKVAKSQLQWDDDWRPEGFDATWDNGTVFAKGLGTYLEGDSNKGTNFAYILQGGARGELGPVRLKGGLGYSDIDAAGEECFFGGSNPGITCQGNSVNATGQYAFDFRVLDVFAELGFSIGQFPLAIWGEWIDNSDADNTGTGYQAGAQLGKAKEKGSWQIKYFYQDLEPDATVGLLTNSDFAGGGTDSKGSFLSGGYALTDQSNIKVSYFLAERQDTAGLLNGGVPFDVNSLQLDVNFNYK